MFGETWGEGPTAVLALHGWRRTHADFASSLGPAAPEGPLPTLAPDLPGFGATPPPPEPWGSAEYASAVAGVLRRENPEAPRSVVVVGHSLGGRVAVRLAASHPELVGALVISGAPLVPGVGSGPRAARAFRLVRTLHRARLVGEDRMERARQRHGSADYRAAHGVMRDVLVRMVNERYDDSLAAVAARLCPVELVWGDDDGDAPVETARAIAARVGGVVLTLCPGAGHLLPLSAPGELRSAVERALARRPA
jgi:pimeloyl-ACP methyl ester carboxylesterase